MMKRQRMGLFLVLLLSAPQLAVAGKVEEKAAGAGDAMATQAADPAMEAWKAYSTPGAPHQLLESFVGKWSHTMRWWESAKAKPVESSGTNENVLVLGNRFLQEHATGTWMGQPFEGMGMTGYDNLRGEYTSTWLDNMGTGMMRSTGQYDAKTKTITQNGEASCPMSESKRMTFRATIKIVDKNRYVYTMYSAGPDGKEFRAMEVNYKRTK